VMGAKKSEETRMVPAAGERRVAEEEGEAGVPRKGSSWWARPKGDGRSTLQTYIDGMKALAPGHAHRSVRRESFGRSEEEEARALGRPEGKTVWARASARGRKLPWTGGAGAKHKVMVPTDGSVFSEAAVKWACENAKLEAEDELALVMCVERMGAVRPVASPPVADGRAELVNPLRGFIDRSIEFQAEKDQARSLLKKDAEVANNTLRLQRGPKHGLRITTEVLLSEGGEGNKGVGKALCAHAVKVGATQIVLGTHGHSAVAQVLLNSVGLGSVSNWVVQHSAIPVVVVRHFEKKMPP